ncbi:MAG TPA: ATP-binding protein [Sandaracinaceae bacterium LLY-WYZ-13_1]|nr:ATP-binding protein [Sandaracinaceae bacterium LLY-WYZ-13_1]
MIDTDERRPATDGAPLPRTALLQLDERGRALSEDASLRALFGPLAGRPWWALADEGQRAAASARWREAARTRRPFEVCARVRTLPCARDARITFQPVDGPAPVRWLAAIDLGEDSDEPVSGVWEVAALRSAADGILVTDADGRIRMANRAAESLFGYEAGALVGRPVELLLPEALRRVHRLARRGYASSPARRTMAERAVWGRRRDGSAVRVEIRLAPMTRDGMVTAVLREKHAEEATAQEPMGHVPPGAALLHELNNPLTALCANLTAARSYLREDAGELAELLADASLGAEQVCDLVRELRLFTHPETDRVEAVSLASVASQAIRLIGADALDRVRIVRRFEAVPPVRASAPRLVQILSNLLVNATQTLAPDEPGRRTIHVRIDRESDGWVRCEVADDGPGIEPAVLPHLFEPGFTTKPDGTGLGLAVARRHVEAFGGRIEAGHRAPRGAVFTLHLPAASP